LVFVFYLPVVKGLEKSVLRENLADTAILAGLTF